MFGRRAVAGAETRLLRFPDICNDRVVFTYGGDLWTVSAQGGTAIRLTAGPGLQQSAKFSPDCTQIAFTGEYSGEDQVYVDAGQRRRADAADVITRRSARCRSAGASTIRSTAGRRTAAASCSVPTSTRSRWRSRACTRWRRTAACPKRCRCRWPASAQYSPDGKQLVYSPLFRDFRTWNRYQGGWAQDLYIFDMATQQGRNITNNPRTDRDPIWIGNAIYFVSDRDDVLNLYRYDIAGRQTTQLTKHRNFDVRWASGDRAGHIVYELGGALRVYDTNTNPDRALVIDVPTDGVHTRPEHVAVADTIEQFGLSPHGERAVFTARGDLFSVPVDKGITRNLTHTSDAHEREAAWSPDGKRIAYVSDASGEEAVWVRDADGDGAAKQLTHDVLGRLYAPRWSPDGKHIAFSDSANRVQVVDVAGGKVSEIAKDPFGLQRDYAWSAKGGYLAYTLNEDNAQGSIFVWSAATGKSERVTDALFGESAPGIFAGRQVPLLPRRARVGAADQRDRIQFRREPQHRRLRADLAEGRTESVPGAERRAEGQGRRRRRDKDKDKDDKARRRTRTKPSSNASTSTASPRA